MLQLLKVFKKLDAYLLSEFWLPLISGAGIITGVWLGIDKFKQVFKLLAQSGAPLSTGLVILGLEIPQILSLTLPISILLATFLAFQKLSSQSEVIAIRAAGWSFTRMMRPVIYLGLIGLTFSFVLSEFIVPVTGPFAERLYMLALYENPINTKAVKGFSYFEKDSHGSVKRIFYVRKFKIREDDNDLLKDVVILDFSKKHISMIHTARRGYWDINRGGWVLLNGSSSYIKQSEDDKKKVESINDVDTNAMHLVTNFEETLVPSSLKPNEILKDLTNVREMNFIGLKKFIEKHEADNIETDMLNEYKTKYYNKFAYPCSCLFLAIIGACLGITGRRRAVNWGYIAMGLVVFVFYMSQTIFDSFGQSGRIPPEYAVWMPNLLLGSLAFITFAYRADR